MLRGGGDAVLLRTTGYSPLRFMPGDLTQRIIFLYS